MRTKALLVILVLCFGASLRPANACVCSNQLLNDREDAAAQFEAAAVVFEGEVAAEPQSIVPPSQHRQGLSMIVFRVARAYKGNLGDLVQLYDAAAGTDCGFDDIRPGQKFFVYGFQGENDRVYIRTCSRTGPLDSAGADIRFAHNEAPTKDDLAPPGEKWRLYRDPTLAQRGASIKGIVHRSDRGDVSGAFVTVWNADETGLRSRIGLVAAVQKVNTDGSFVIRFLPPGQYNVTAVDSRESPTARYVGEYGNVALVERQIFSSVVVPLHAEPLGNVRVRVIAPKELYDRMVVLLRDTKVNDTRLAPYAYSQTSQIDHAGEASFQFVPYGRYDVYVMTGEDLGKPSWTHDEVQVQLNGSQLETSVSLRKTRQE